MNSNSRRALTAGALVLGLLGVGVSTAQASSSAGSPVAQAGITCGFLLEDSRVGARCTYPGPTSRQFRAWAACTNGRIATGPWLPINSGGRSWANCGRNVFVRDWGVDLSV